MLREIIYIAKCPDGNCEITKEKVKRVRNKNNTGYKVCREHGGKIIKRKTNCIDCEKEIYLESTGPGKLRCSGCAIEKNRLRTAKVNEEKRKHTVVPRGPKPKIIDYGRGTYCTGISVCALIKRKPECRGCQEYIPIVRGVDPEILGYWTL